MLSTSTWRLVRALPRPTPQRCAGLWAGIRRSHTAASLDEALYNERNVREIESAYDSVVVGNHNSEMLTTQLQKRLRTGQQLDHMSFESMPYWVHPSTAEQLHLFSKLQFVNSVAATHFAGTCPSFNGILVLQSMRRNTEQYQEAIAMALAQHYKASFLDLDPLDFLPPRAPTAPNVKRAGRTPRLGRLPGMNDNSMVVMLGPALDMMKGEHPAASAQNAARSKADDRFRLVIACALEAVAGAQGDAKQPLVLFLRDFHSIVSSDERLATLTNQLNKARRERPVVVVGSAGIGAAADREKQVPPQAMLQRLMNMGEQEEDQGSAPTEFDGVSNLWIYEPTEHYERDAWLKQMDMDAHVMTQRANHRLVAKTLCEAKIGHEPLGTVRGLDGHLLDPYDAELLVGWALSRHTRDHVPVVDLQVEEVGETDAEAKRPVAVRRRARVELMTEAEREERRLMLEGFKKTREELRLRLAESDSRPESTESESELRTAADAIERDQTVETAEKESSPESSLDADTSRTADTTESVRVKLQRMLTDLERTIETESAAVAAQDKPAEDQPVRKRSSTSKPVPRLYMSAGDLQHACDLWLRSRDLAVISGQQPVKPHGAKEMPKLNNWEKKLVGNLLTPGTLDVKFDDIGSLDNAKRLLKEIISLPLQRAELFSRGILAKSVSGVLLFGPPGTGKTMLAKAVAAESGSNFLHVSMSDIMNEFVGQSEKCAKAVFTLARKMAPCVIFLDEVDSLFAARGSRTGYTTKREALNEFMMEWDGLKSHNGRVIVMAATNRPFDLDEAVIRRMPRRVMIDLPDLRAREQILSVILRQESLGDVNLTKLAGECEGYSGSDLSNLCLAAAMRSVREIIEREERTGERHHGQPRLEWHHFVGAKSDIKKSVNEDTESIKQLHDWNAKYGEGAKSKPRPSIGFAAPLEPPLKLQHAMHG